MTPERLPFESRPEEGKKACDGNLWERDVWEDTLSKAKTPQGRGSIPLKNQEEVQGLWSGVMEGRRKGDELRGRRERVEQALDDTD